MTYGSDADLLRYLALHVDIDLVKLGSFNLPRKLLEDRGYNPAWPTPCGPEIDQDGLAAVDLERESREQVLSG
jgi:hypothetical protein